MSSVITLPRQLYERLLHKSQQLACPPDQVVVDLVEQYLDEPTDRWPAELQALLDRVQARTADFPSDEIEADISAAAAEVRELRRGRRAA